MLQFSSDTWAWESLIATSGSWSMASQVAVAEKCPRCQLCAFEGRFPDKSCPGGGHSAQDPLLCCRCQPLPAVGAPMHDLEAAAAPRQALSYSPAQHLGGEHPPGLPLGCLATTTAASRAASPPGTTGQLAALLGPQRTYMLCRTLLGVGSLESLGLG